MQVRIYIIGQLKNTYFLPSEHDFTLFVSFEVLFGTFPCSEFASNEKIPNGLRDFA